VADSQEHDGEPRVHLQVKQEENQEKIKKNKKQEKQEKKGNLFLDFCAKVPKTCS
jgi:hypothetical protein